jgi:release factor glutamine methyltransferase
MTKTISNILFQSAQNLKSNKINNVTKLDIEYCLMETLGKNRAYLHAHGEEEISNQELIKFNKLLKDILLGKPLAQVLGYQDFYKNKFFINDNVLIPRLETEILIPKILELGDEIYNKNNQLILIDAGSGSGCIGLSVAIERQNWSIILIEKSAEAIEVLLSNCKKHNVSNCTIIMSDWLTAISGKLANIIVSNPPYIDIENEQVEYSVKKFEPNTSLYSNENGFSDIKALITDSKRVLANDGLLILENGSNQSTKVLNLLNKNYYKDIDIILDYNGINRFTLSRYS